MFLQALPFRFLVVAAVATVSLGPVRGAESVWKKHSVHEGAQSLTAIAADFTKDGIPDIIANSAEKTRLFVGPNWKEVIIDATKGHDFIHSEVIDVDADGDLDFIGARYQPGLIIWLEQPDKPLTDPWPLRIVSTELNGIHGLLTGDVDRDGRIDLIANSAQPVNTRFPESLVWLTVPRDARTAKNWPAHAFADKDAPGLSHYLGFGDVNGDGRPDAATGAKGDPLPSGITSHGGKLRPIQPSRLKNTSSPKSRSARPTFSPAMSMAMAKRISLPAAAMAKE